MDDSLPRTQRPLTEGHKVLIRLLAERAVADYLHEVEAAEQTDDNGRAKQQVEEKVR